MKGSKQSRTDLLEKKLQATINIIKHFVDGGVVDNCVNKTDLAG